MVALLAGVGLAGDVKVGLMGGDASLGARAGYEVNDGLWVGVEGFGWENASGVDKGAYTLAGFVAWDVVQDYNLPVKGLTLGLLPLPENIPVGLTIGGSVGGEVWVDGRSRSGLADLWGEVVINPKSKAPFGVQYRHAFGPDVWSNLPDLPDADYLMLVICGRF